MERNDDSPPTEPEMNDWHWRLLARHFSGVASPEEKTWLEQWEIADPDRVELVRKLRTVWELSAGRLEGDETTGARSASDGRAREAWAQLRDQIHAQDQAVEPRDKKNTDRDPETRATSSGQQPRSRARRRRGLLSVQVAALLAAASLAAILWQPVSEVLTRRIEAPAMRELVADQGERVHAMLGDGTRIVLGPASRVRVPVRFGSDARTLELQGIAYLEVAPDPRRPFRIHVGDAVVEALGTAFALRAYPGDSALEVAVSEGKVALRPRAFDSVPRVVLGRGQLGRIEADGTISLSDDPMALERQLAWLDGRLAFHDAPLLQVFQDLERWYGAKLRVQAAELNDELLTLSIEGETLSQVLDAIALSLDLRYERDGETVVFYAKGAG